MSEKLTKYTQSKQFSSGKETKRKTESKCVKQIYQRNQSASQNTNQFTKTEINFKTPTNSQNQNHFFIHSNPFQLHKFVLHKSHVSYHQASNSLHSGLPALPPHARPSPLPGPHSVWINTNQFHALVCWQNFFLAESLQSRRINACIPRTWYFFNKWSMLRCPLVLSS